jgi:hypothetical protein
MGILETFVGLGMSVGPVIGGVLYSVFKFDFVQSSINLAILTQIGGFGLPFYTLGVLMIIFVPVNIFLLPAADGWSLFCAKAIEFYYFFTLQL